MSTEPFSGWPLVEVDIWHKIIVAAVRRGGFYVFLKLIFGSFML